MPLGARSIAGLAHPALLECGLWQGGARRGGSACLTLLNGDVMFSYSVAHDLIFRSELNLFDQIAPSWFSVLNKYACVLIILRADPAQVPGSNQIHREFWLFTVGGGRSSLIRSTTGNTTPSSACTRRPDEFWPRTESPHRGDRNKSDHEVAARRRLASGEGRRAAAEGRRERWAATLKSRV
ncbi:putative malic acid transport protein, malate permease [Dorcoceras hygrometricum]|uniref:Putative malic acid transport protein, malate permease n=1 Tax=Dorcoceras hygrometricum TaxID=472368 RepID=A0A2Z7BN80_9LAMI|nr:putative malic acid transport protein, malate permease [Dorcoceras hygrometricum]